jgi:hypothetical protein
MRYLGSYLSDLEENTARFSHGPHRLHQIQRIKADLFQHLRRMDRTD